MVQPILKTQKGSKVFFSEYYPCFVALSPKMEEWQDVYNIMKDDLNDPDMPDDIRSVVEEVITLSENAVEVSLEELMAFDALATKKDSGAVA